MLYAYPQAGGRVVQPSVNILSMALSEESAKRFEEHAIPHISALYAFACWMTHDPSEAEDLVQETLTKALRAFNSFSPETNFKAWIFRILRNTFLTSRTALASLQTVFLEEHPGAVEVTDPSPTPEAQVIRLNDQVRVQEAIAQLPAPLREVLLLCDLEELKYREIAAVLDVPIGTVMSRLSRARQMLRQILSTYSGGKP